ncbi:metal tolerance protein b [Phtheirospermum japonicum]|uniref:Metal tolerance protein b n=1 Tax=Phtheirospermum japonicum TaxID=374723 RepID=A0A830C4J9_9LAMI|nr:metal tolerance protein b [Phtheirospermum japonicum]
METGSTELQPVKIDTPTPAAQETNDFPPKQHLSCSATCPFSNREYNKTDAAKRSKTTLKLCGLILVYTMTMIIQIVGGLRANSLAILTDAAHLLSDIAGFSVSLFTVWVSGWEATPQQSFGFNRLEVMGALLSVQLIWLISGTLIYEAIERLITKRGEVNGKLMFAIAAFGFLVNFLLVFWLGHDHSHHSHGAHNHETEDGEESQELVSDSHEKTEMLNINIEGAYLHLVTDLIQSVGVMIGGCIIWVKPKWLVVDLVCTLVFSFVALCTTLPMLRNVFFVLMERAPKEVDIVCLENGLKCIGGVCGVHDLHVWAITVGKHVLSCHVVIGPEVRPNEVLNRIREYCEHTFGISHVTIQLEQE